MRESYRRNLAYDSITRLGCADTRQAPKNQCYNSYQMREILPNRRQIGEKYIYDIGAEFSRSPTRDPKETRAIFRQNHSLIKRVMDSIPVGTKIETSILNHGQRIPATIILRQKFIDGQDRHSITSTQPGQSRISSSNFLNTAGIICFEPGDPIVKLNPQKLFEYTGLNPKNQLDRQLFVGKQIRQGHGHGIRSVRRRDYSF